MKFSNKEIRDLTISIIVLALAFTGFNLKALPLTLVIIVAVFASHEILGHKFFAQRYGCEAEYKMWILGLGLGILTGIFGGFVFAAPGAVYISSFSKDKFAFTINRITKKEYGIISLSGPLVNVIIGSVCLVLSFLYYPLFFGTIAKISFLLAFFNMLPIGPLDGGHVLAWNKYVWLVMIACSFGLYYISSLSG